MKKILLDTDLGADCDDATALAYLSALHAAGEIDFIGASYSLTSPYGPAAIRAICRDFGKDGLPVGVMPPDPSAPGDHFCRMIAEKFAKPEDDTAEDAVPFLRRMLADAKEPVTVVGIGPLTNLAALLDSPADKYFDGTGAELVKGACDCLVVMGGCFSDDPRYCNKSTGIRMAEWNVNCDIPAARRVLTDCPVPLYILPLEIGLGMLTGGGLCRQYGESRPMTLAFFHTPGVNPAEGRASWDPATAHFAVMREGSGLCVSARGRVRLTERGETYWDPDNGGNTFLLSVPGFGTDKEADDKAAVAAAIDRTIGSK